MIGETAMAAKTVLVLATIACGLTAGFFFAWTVSITPGTALLDDAGYIAAMQSINRAVRNAGFFAAFFGTVPLTVAALALLWRRGPSASAWLVVAGLVLYLAAFVITAAANVPLNERLATATDTPGADLAAIRAAYEGPWNAWNLTRTVASGAAFACLTVAALLTAAGAGAPAVVVGAQPGGGDRTWPTRGSTRPSSSVV